VKTLLILFFPFLLPGNGKWLTDIDQAKSLSKEKHELILLNFSGSDWCNPCIRMHKDIFESAVFQQFAEDHLVLVNADFPRLKKNSLPADLQKKNDALAEKYDPEGFFPYTVLLDSNGAIIKKWNGYYESGAENFVNEIKLADGHSSNQ
jgi:thioredoxin-related protein